MKLLQEQVLYNTNKVTDPEGDLVGSMCPDYAAFSDVALHTPMFDFDFPVIAIPRARPRGTSTSTCSQAVTHNQYRDILDAFVRAGLVQATWANNLQLNGQTFLRIQPGVKVVADRRARDTGERVSK